uniref:G_PROTEIN_RECEP_F1_2 domain-containing protein n=1 Tax=Steinernema glaseri TaxID=37863 RepID=A0A1I7YTK6_9BILA
MSINTLIGLFYIISNGIAFPIYAIFLCVFISRDPFRNSTTFLIKFWLGVMECTQILSGMQSGFMTLFNIAEHDFVERLGGAFNCMALFTRPILLFVLACHRLLKVSWISSNSACSCGARFIKIPLSFAFILALWHFVYRLTDTGKAQFSLEFHVFRPPPYVPGTLNALFRDIVVNIDIVTITLTCLLDALIMAIFCCMKKSKGLQKIRQVDIPAMVHALLTLTHVFVVKCGSNDLYEGLLKKHTFNVMFIVWLQLLCTVNPLFYLFFVSRLRNEFLKFIRCRPCHEQARKPVYVLSKQESVVEAKNDNKESAAKRKNSAEETRRIHRLEVGKSIVQA